MNTMHVYVRTPLKRDGKILPPGKDSIELPADEARVLIAARAVEPRDLEAPPHNPDEEANDPAGTAPGAAGEAGETKTNPNDPPGTGAQPGGEGLVNVNIASVAELKNAGLTDSAAKAIVGARKKLAKDDQRFESLDALSAVHGIGGKTIDKVRDRLTV